MADHKKKKSKKVHTPTAVVALGGHAFMSKGQIGTHEDHLANAQIICKQLMTLVERGYNIAITHGNGPQVGDLSLRNEAVMGSRPDIPLDVLVAQTEGSLGHYMQLSLLNELRRRKIRRFVVTVVSQVVVSRSDPAFENFTKPVGQFFPREEAERRAQSLGWVIGEDAQGRGWRRLVPSPTPVKIIQRDMIRESCREGHIVVAGGGGGIPIRKDENLDYVGIEAVIDKDLTSSVLASDIGADLLVILTAVDQVFLNFNTERQLGLGAVTMAECRNYMDTGHFPAGSMGPKIDAVYGFLERGGKRALVTSPERLGDALDGQAGTHFVGRICERQSSRVRAASRSEPGRREAV